MREIVSKVAPWASAVPPFERHTLVWLDPDNWQDYLLTPLEGSVGTPAHEELKHWIAAGRPAVVCRREAEERRSISGRAAGGADVTSEIRLGVALPPRGNVWKRRVAFSIGTDAVRRTAPPLKLDDSHVIECAPAGWRALLDELCARGAKHGIVWRVFGSLSWQRFGAAGYLTATSDLDLLWKPHDVGELDAGIMVLQQMVADSKSRPEPLPQLDGEIVFSRGRGVSWREWAAVGGSESVLVKSVDEVTLLSRGALRDSLRDNRCNTSAALAGSPTALR